MSNNYYDRRKEVLRRIDEVRPFFPPNCWWEFDGPCPQHDNEACLVKLEEHFGIFPLPLPKKETDK